MKMIWRLPLSPEEVRTALQPLLVPGLEQETELRYRCNKQLTGRSTRLQMELTLYPGASATRLVLDTNRDAGLMKAQGWCSAAPWLVMAVICAAGAWRAASFPLTGFLLLLAGALLLFSLVPCSIYRGCSRDFRRMADGLTALAGAEPEIRYEPLTLGD